MEAGVKRRRKRTVAVDPSGIVQPEGSIVKDRSGDFREILSELGQVFVARTNELRAMMVALIAGQNYLLIGPRGTAKTAMANAMAKHIVGATQFTTLLGSFSTLNELVGRIDLAALQRGEEKRKTEGKLLDCDFAFLDEILKGSDGVLNCLLGILSDNRDFDGQKTRLWSVGSATNWPEVERRSDRISALYDRFHWKIPVAQVTSRDERLKVIEASITLSRGYQPKTTVTVENLREAAEQAKGIQVADVAKAILCSLQERCQKEKIDISDRRVGQWVTAMRASAWLDGRPKVAIQDISTLIYMAWDDRPHIESVAPIWQTCDREIGQALIAKIDESKKKYRAAQQNLTAEVAAKLLDSINESGQAVYKVLESFQLSETTLLDISTAAKGLKEDYKSMCARFGGAVETRMKELGQ